MEMGTGDGSIEHQYGSGDEPAYVWNLCAGHLASHSAIDGSAGLRYENQRPATERHNRLVYFDKTAINPISDAFGSPLNGAV